MERESFDRLVADHLPAMLRLAVRLTGDAHAAEDLMQDALLKAVKYQRTFRGAALFSTWMTRIVINAFRDRLAARPPLMLAGPEPATHAGDEAQARDMSRHIARLVSSLPPRQREALVLTAYESMSNADAAGVMGVSEQNLRTHLSLARRKLREQLAGEIEP